MTSKGQITVPKEVRDELGLEPGTKVTFVRIGPGDYRMRPKVRSVMDLVGALDYDGAPVSLEQMDEAIQEGATGRSS
jgi:AbrB family looped-hinge helix DNA binding protein